MRSRYRKIGVLFAAAALTTPLSQRCEAQSVVPAPAAPVEANLQFQAFVTGFRAAAIAAGIDPQVYDLSVAGITLDPQVEALNSAQPEFVKPIWEYLDSAVSFTRITAGQEMLAAYAPTLAVIEQRFGVQKEILVAIWGIESDFGREMGGFNMFEALATLAYQGPRSDFGRRELLDALRIEQQEHLAPATMTSSWAGAFGQTQFVPSAFLRYAVDGDGDGRRDLWRSPADALASAANLLLQSGWEREAPWGYEVVLPANFPYELADPDKPSTIDAWRALGVRAAGGYALPASQARAAIYLPAGARGPAFMIFDNFHTVLKYNNAASYALAVCLLADRLKGYPPIAAAWPRDAVPLSRPEQLSLQNDLLRLGFDPGPLDGILGRQGRAALRAWQKSRGRIPDGFATESVLEQVERELPAR
ncbi:MAG TPA: lytic murein transglycosylase [Rhizomicrobium sp.]|jgi:membrane-bound lytic murein transglycosylase B